MNSQNGWSTIDGSNLDKSPIPGTSVVPVPGLRTGDVATVLLHVGKLFNETVAEVYNPGCWGYAAPIPIPGTNIISNHGSGTAIDLNAPSFPWKLRRMTPAQRKACRSIVDSLGGVVAWGGDFTTFVDEMHFEIVGNAQEVAEVAKRIKGDDMTEDTQLDFDILSQKFKNLTGRRLDKKEFKGQVGRSWRDVDLTFQQSDEAAAWYALAELGKKAQAEGWAKPGTGDKKLAEAKRLADQITKL